MEKKDDWSHIINVHSLPAGGTRVKIAKVMTFHAPNRSRTGFLKQLH